jgi:NAD(P)-dependent dehydrogenase (short-subunit alcohol dehydrogenase family)
MLEDMYTPTESLSNEFTGVRALVTGGSRGIGAAIAQRFLDGGATVVTAARSATEDTPGASLFIAGDVGSADGAKRLVDQAVETLGGLDVVINNAGAAQVHMGGASTIPDDEWQQSLDVNFLSAVRVLNAALPALKDSGAAAVVNIAATGALSAPPPLLHYGTAKAALLVYTKGMAQELAPSGIRVNSVTPGSVRTPGGTAVLQSIADAVGAPLEAITANIPLGRVGDARDIGEIVAFLSSARAQWITGQNFVVSGGE